MHAVQCSMRDRQRCLEVEEEEEEEEDLDPEQGSRLGKEEVVGDIHKVVVQYSV